MRGGRGRAGAFGLNAGPARVTAATFNNNDENMKRSAAIPWSFTAALSLTAFAVNWIWEMVQMPAFVEMSQRTWRETALICTVATLGDVVITLAICGIGALAAGDLRWGTRGSWNVYLATAFLGGLCAAALEWFAQATGRWTYNANMPIVPGLKLGLWPLIQLTVLTPLSFAIARFLASSLEHAQGRRPSQGLVP